MPVRRSRIVPTEARGALAASLEALRRSLDLPASFPPEAQAEAERAAAAVPVDPAAAGLADLRHIEFLTIDPAGSTDLDQAVHLERTATGAILHYAIADVPAYVAPGGALDGEARRRAQTIYAPDGRIPLHPPVLSEHAASLLPEQDRRAYVWRFVLDDGARPVQTTLTRAVVRSRAQWAYAEAQEAIDLGTAPLTLLAMPWFGAERDARESERGGASLNLPETRVVAEGDGYRLESRDGVPLEEWNAHVSLLTGMAAAEIMLAGGVGILRTMPQADPDDVAEFRAQTIALGLPWRFDIPYGTYLSDLPHTPAGRAVREYAGGLFRGAGYVAFDGDPPDDPRQAAIGAPYAHTTAPLRRLVDRWSLVICDALANGRPVPDWARQSLPEVPALMAAGSQRAGRMDAGAIDRVEAAVLRGREGEVFDGVVLSVRGDGARVQLRRPPVEAKVAGLGDVVPGAEVRLRLDAASIADGTALFSEAAS
ncbi:RNB domain-containing ribonuclease [Microbacterium saccharophilum]|uniref:RNB domain-containing ribonuclease n=1 Tax=Microbacterium saccharophilum TaxID=1213358 RepID=A0A5C8I0F9_9MICO|nr:RNB domain-containing ribonuclease [Microbacterium saccharophilum]TXK10666.1 RNB domain-containing ribonuclease [Microbacterium saccharophilum]GEP48258.1 ribonuclease R [Microbacterium saccharophilum]